MNNEVFPEIYNAQSGITQITPHELSVLLTKFRNDLSFKWIMSKADNQEEYLRLVLITILQLTEEKNTGIRLAAYSTIGKLLLSVAPYSPILFINAFEHAITSLPVSSRISIAIINTFMSLMRFVSPVRIQSFVNNMPILHHFSADISDFIRYLPKTMLMMSKLPLEFQQRILHPLVSSCQKEPNNSFSISISLLIDHNPQQLLPHLMKCILNEKLDIAAIWIGPNLLNSKDNFNLLTKEGKEFFLSNSLEQLHLTNLNVTHFEYACKIIAFFLRYTKNTSEYSEIHQRYQSNLLPSYTGPFKTSLLVIPSDSLDHLIDNPNEPDSVRSLQLAALVNYFYDHFDTVDCDQIAEMIYDLRNTTNDLYSSVIEHFSTCINDLFVKCKKSFHIDLFKHIITHKNANWVQNMKLVKLIDKANFDLCVKYIENYQDIVINLLIDFTISPKDSLFEASVEVMKNIASYDNIVTILNKIQNSDWIQEKIVYKRFYLLAELKQLFDHAHFSYFVDLAYEILLFTEKVKLHSIIFKFLSISKVNYLPTQIMNFSFNFIEKYYFYYSKLRIDEKIELDEISNQPIDYDTDIVTNPLINHKHALAHIKNCYKFLCSFPPNIIETYKDRLFQYSIALVPIFDKFALEMAAKLAVGDKKAEFVIWNLSIDTFKTTNNDDVAATCCSIFVDDQRDLPDYIVSMLEQFLGEKCTANPELLFLCFLNVDQNNHEKVVNAIPTVLSWLSVKNGTVLLFKLIQIVGKDIIPSIKDEYGLSLLQYANEFHGVYSDIVRRYIQITDFADFPISEPTMNENLIEFMEDEPKIMIKNPSKLDLDHWKFVFEYVFVFDLSNLSDYIENNKSVFSKINANSLHVVNDRQFVLSKDYKNQTTFPSTCPFIFANTFVRSSSLLKSMSLFRKRVLPTKLFKNILNYLVEIKDLSSLKEFLRYSLLTRQDKFIEINDDIYFNDFLIHYTSMISPEKVLENLSIPNNSKLIIDENLNENIRLGIVSKNPDYYLQYLIDFPKFKKKHFLILIKLLMTVRFSIEKLSDLILKYITQFPNFTSMHQKEIFARFLTSSLLCFRHHMKPDEYKSFFNFLSYHFTELAVDADGGLLNEFGLLYFILSQYSSEESFHTEFLRTILQITSAPPYFLMGTVLNIVSRQPESESTASSFARRHNDKNNICSIINIEQFPIIFALELPSFSSSIMKILKYIPPSNDFLLDIQGKFDLLNYKLNFKFVKTVCSFVQKYGSAYSQFETIFLNDSKDACFNECLKIANMESGIVTNIIFDSNYCSGEVVNFICNNLTKKSSDVAQKAMRLFIEFPSVPSWPMIEQIFKLKILNNLISTLFLSMAKDINSFLPLYCCLKQFYLRLDHSNQEKVQEIIQLSADYFTVYSRFFSLMMLWEKDVKSINMGFITAASECNNFHKAAGKFEKLCCSEKS